MDTSGDATVGPYDPAANWPALWAFALELAAGDGAKAARYEGKLTETTASATGRGSPTASSATPAASSARAGEQPLAGYAFVLPAALAMVWDGAVLNELYLAPERRGTGAADRRLDAAVAPARGQELPLDRLPLDVAPDNERAAACYERRGFEPWDEVVAHDLR